MCLKFKSSSHWCTGVRWLIMLLKTDAAVVFAAENIKMLPRTHAMARRSLTWHCLKMGSGGLFLSINSKFRPPDLYLANPPFVYCKEPRSLFVMSIIVFSYFFNLVFFLKVVVTAAEAALGGTSMDLQSVQNTVSLWKICPAAAVGRISRCMFVLESFDYCAGPILNCF